jgi:hypothetical protein
VTFETLEISNVSKVDTLENAIFYFIFFIFAFFFKKNKKKNIKKKKKKKLYVVTLTLDRVTIYSR